MIKNTLIEKAIKLEIMPLLAACLLSVNAWINNWVWEPTWSIGIMLVVLLADFLTGTTLSLKNGEGFSTKKATAWGWSVLSTWVLLGIAHNMPRLNREFGFTEIETLIAYIPRALYLYILLIQLGSAIKNAALAGILKGAIADFALKYIDTYKKKLDKDDSQV